LDQITDRLASEPMTRIVALGSSNTELAYHSEGGHNWFGWLEVGIRDHYGRVHQMVNAGVSGETSRDLLSRFERDVALYCPHVVIVTVGGNDCNPESGISLDQFRSNLTALVRAVREIGNCEPILQTYYSFDIANMPEEPDRAALFPQYMSAVREVAADGSAIVIDHLVRWERLRTRRPDAYRTLMRDAMHLNPLGNMVLGLDVLRHFGVQVSGETAQHCRQGIEVQHLLDELERDARPS
jgi:lysophospholipase L1-like esterase